MKIKKILFLLIAAVVLCATAQNVYFLLLKFGFSAIWVPIAIIAVPFIVVKLFKGNGIFTAGEKILSMLSFPITVVVSLYLFFNINVLSYSSDFGDGVKGAVGGIWQSLSCEVVGTSDSQLKRLKRDLEKLEAKIEKEEKFDQRWKDSWFVPTILVEKTSDVEILRDLFAEQEEFYNCARDSALAKAASLAGQGLGVAANGLSAALELITGTINFGRKAVKGTVHAVEGAADAVGDAKNWVKEKVSGDPTPEKPKKQDTAPAPQGGKTEKPVPAEKSAPKPATKTPRDGW